MTAKIAFVGICQVVGMADALRVLLPGSEVHPYHVTQFDENVDRFLSAIVDFDLVISQMLPSHGIPQVLEPRLRDRGIRNLQFIPPIVFGGFHPDACLIMNGPHQLESPITSFHSRILAAAFLMDLPVARAVGLFNSFIYAKLGYGLAYEAAQGELLRALEPYGLGELATQGQERWNTPDAFMHTPLHPKVRVLASFATEAARRVGLVGPDASDPEGVADVLGEQHVWPVYPGLAERIGVPGDLIFRAYRSTVASDAERDLDLETFAARSFDIYARSPGVLAANPSLVQTAQTLSALIR